MIDKLFYSSLVISLKACHSSMTYSFFRAWLFSDEEYYPDIEKLPLQMIELHVHRFYWLCWNLHVQRGLLL